MAIEAYQKAQQAAEDRANPPKPQGPTMQSILASSKDSALFGSLLKQDGGQQAEELAAKIAEGTLDEGNIADLEKFRMTYFEKTERAKEIGNGLTKESVEKFARNSPEFQAVVNMVGPDKAIAVIKGQLLKLCIEDESRFNNIADAMETLNETKGEMQTMDRAISGVLKRHKVTDAEYTAIMRIEDDGERQDEMRRLIRSKHSMWERMFSSGRGRVGDATRLSEEKGDIDAAIAVLNADMKSVGGALATTVDENPDVRRALTDEMVGEKSPTGPQNSGFKEIQGDKKNMMSQETIDTEWAAHKATVADWDTLSDPDKDTQRNAFRDAQEKKFKEQRKGQHGFWATVMELLFKNTLKSKPLA